MAKETELLWFELNRLEEKIDDLDELTQAMAAVVASNHEAIHILADIIQKRSEARIDWLN